jgi:hypothetical protein
MRAPVEAGEGLGVPLGSPTQELAVGHMNLSPHDE